MNEDILCFLTHRCNRGPRACILYLLYPYLLTQVCRCRYTKSMRSKIEPKDRNVFIGMAVTAIVTGVLVFYSGANNIPPAPQEVRVAAVVVPFTKLAAGTKSSVEERVNYLIKSPDELKKLWKIIK